MFARVSEEHVSIIRAVDTTVLKLQATSLCKTLISCQASWCHNPEYHNVNQIGLSWQ